MIVQKKQITEFTTPDKTQSSPGTPGTDFSKCPMFSKSNSIDIKRLDDAYNSISQQRIDILNIRTSIETNSEKINDNFRKIEGSFAKIKNTKLDEIEKLQKDVKNLKAIFPGSLIIISLISFAIGKLI